MKRILVTAFFAGLLVSCHPHKALSLTQEQIDRFPPNTIVEPDDADDVMDEYSRADTEKLVDTFAITINKKQFQTIISQFKVPFRWSLVRAIYNEKTAAVYARRNSYPNTTCRDCEKVSGLPTLLLEVKDPDGAAAYFDIVTLCPPPQGPGCELQREKSYINVQ